MLCAHTALRYHVLDTAKNNAGCHWDRINPSCNNGHDFCTGLDISILVRVAEDVLRGSTDRTETWSKRTS